MRTLQFKINKNCRSGTRKITQQNTKSEKSICCQDYAKRAVFYFSFATNEEMRRRRSSNNGQAAVRKLETQFRTLQKFRNCLKNRIKTKNTVVSKYVVQ